jgi:hypothetical protein
LSLLGEGDLPSSTNNVLDKTSSHGFCGTPAFTGLSGMKTFRGKWGQIHVDAKKFTHCTIDHNYNPNFHDKKLSILTVLRKRLSCPPACPVFSTPVKKRTPYHLSCQKGHQRPS